MIDSCRLTELRQDIHRQAERAERIGSPRVRGLLEDLKLSPRERILWLRMLAEHDVRNVTPDATKPT